MSDGGPTVLNSSDLYFEKTTDPQPGDVMFGSAAARGKGYNHWALVKANNGSSLTARIEAREREQVDDGDHVAGFAAFGRERLEDRSLRVDSVGGVGSVVTAACGQQNTAQQCGMEVFRMKFHGSSDLDRRFVYLA